MESQTEMTTSTAAAESNDNVEQVSYGLVGFFVFVGVLIILFVVKKRCAHDKQTASDSEMECSFKSACNEDVSIVDETTYNDSHKGRYSAYGWNMDDKELLYKHLIDTRRLSIEKQIGKGKHYDDCSVTSEV